MTSMLTVCDVFNLQSAETECFCAVKSARLVRVLKCTHAAAAALLSLWLRCIFAQSLWFGLVANQYADHIQKRSLSE